MTVRVRTGEALSPGARWTLDEATTHHLTNVLRLSDGAVIEAVDADGGVWSARLDGAALAILALSDVADANPVGRLEVWLPLLKGGRTDDLVRQLTELGAARIVPFVSSRTVKRPDDKRLARQLERWRTIADEATRQCRRTDRVEITEVRRGLPDTGTGVFLWEGGGRPAADLLRERVERGELAVLVGPEGGLASAEAEALEAAGWAAASLGARVLRAETAVVAVAVLGLAALGEAGYGVS